MSHAYLPPSGSHAWRHCAMWPTMNALFPQDASPDTLEGDAAHWVGTELWAGRQQVKVTTAPNGLIVTDEMVDGAELLVDTLHARMANRVVHVEERLSMSDLHPKCFGTPDYWSTSGYSHHIEIVDYKFGHRFVDEYFNPQGLCYLCGILQKIRGEGQPAHPDTTVTFTIVQPRCFYKGEPVRSHSFNFTEALRHTQALKAAAYAADAEQPTATTNKACIDCPGRHACPALQLAAYSDAETATDGTPLEIAPEAAALELAMLSRALERLTARVDGLTELTTANLKLGKRVPYFHLEQGHGRTKWNVPDGQVIALGQLYGVDLFKPGTITPTQATKLGLDADVIKPMTVTPATSHRLVRDDPRDVRRVFAPSPEVIL